MTVLFHSDYGALPIARTLGRLGVPLYLMFQAGVSHPATSSRYWAEKTRWDFFRRPEEDSLTLLRDTGSALAKRHGARSILLTNSDWFAVFIDRHADSLREYFHFPQSAPSIVPSLLNKWELHALATEHHIPTPLTAQPTTEAEVDDFVAKAGFPLVLKPTDVYLSDRPPKAIIRSRPELRETVQHAMNRGSWNFILQEYIPGGVDTVWMCNGYFGVQPGHGVTFTGKKLRQASSTGIASFAVCAPNDTVASQTYRFLTEVGYRGCVGVGHRYDARDGTYKVLDVNARVSSVFRLFAGANDLDVVRLCYLDLSGQPMGRTAAQPGRKWLLETDLKAMLPRQRKDRVSVREWLRSVRGVEELHWFAHDDLAPVGAWMGQAIAGKINGLVRPE